MGCEYYEVAGTALVEKTPEPMKPLEHLGEGRFIAVYEKKAQGDFKGALDGGGAIAFEAKSTEGCRIEQNVVTKEQRGWMDRQYRFGAVCFVLVSTMSGGQFFRVPWEHWRTMKERWGRKYLTVEDMAAAGYRVPVKYHKGDLAVLFLARMEI